MAEKNTVTTAKSSDIILTPNIPLTLFFNPSEATFSTNGENLVIEFDNGNTVNVVNYKSLAENDELPSIVFSDGQEIPGDSYLANFADTIGDDLETAAGQTGGQTSSGGGAYDDQAGSLFDGLDLVGGQGDPEASTLNSITPNTDLFGSPTPDIIVINPSEFIVGTNSNDIATSQSPFITPASSQGALTGSFGNDILVGDFGGNTTTETVSLTSTNFILLLDVSPSMQGTSFDSLQLSLNNLLDSIYDKVAVSNDGLVQVSLIPFSTTVNTETVLIFDKTSGEISFNGTTIKSDFTTTTKEQDLRTAKAWVSELGVKDPTGDYNFDLTNYEDPLRVGIDNLKGNAPTYDQQHVIFLSDGEPNTHLIGDLHTPQLGGNEVVTDIFGDTKMPSSIPSPNNGIPKITFPDTIDEVTDIQSLADSVRVVGINLDTNVKLNGDVGIQVTLGSGSDEKEVTLSTRADLLDTMDSTGVAITLSDTTDLSSTLQNITHESLSLAPVGSDRFHGGNGNDIIFGDALFTDDVASNLKTLGFTISQEVVNLPNGSGWQVFEELESGKEWTRADTISYIANTDNHNALKSESLDINQSGRNGGNDIINGGNGDDIIFAQEGDDIIFGGDGNDLIDGGSGNDIFIVSNNDKVTLGEGKDTILIAKEMLDTTGARVAITDFDITNDIIDINFAGASIEWSQDRAELTFSQSGSSLVLEFESVNFSSALPDLQLPSSLSPAEQQIINDLINQNG